jgi:hypothetical protein
MQQSSNQEQSKYYDAVSIFSECAFKGGVGVCFGGVLEGPTTSASFNREGGDKDRLLSICILSSTMATGEGALDAGDNVAMGGNEVLPLPCEECPAPIGLGWGGNTAGRGELGGYGSVIWRASGECDAG